MKASELNSFGSIRAIRGRSWLATILVVLLVPKLFAQTDFSAFWKNFSSVVIASEKATAAEMTKFPLSMPYGVKAVKDQEDFLRRYNEIFKGEANATQCFRSAKPQKESARRYEIYCSFKESPDDKENAPIRFIFELTKGGWKFAGLDNINEWAINELMTRRLVVCILVLFICARGFGQEMYLKAGSLSPSPLSASPTPAATASRFGSLAEAVAEANRLRETNEGKHYDSEFGTAIQATRPQLADVVHECAKDSKLPIVFDVVFIFDADGRVESTLHTPDQNAAVCVADKLRTLRLPAPPRAGWPVQLHIELGPANEAMKKRTGPNPATSKDMQLAMQADKAKVAGNYEEALRLYARAIKLNGHFTPFVYQNRGMLYLNRAKESTDRQARIADLQKAMADFKKSIALGAESDDELNRGLEKIATKANLEEATKLLAEEAGQ